MGEISDEEAEATIADALMHDPKYIPTDTPKPLSAEDGEQPEQEPEHVWDGTVRP